MKKLSIYLDTSVINFLFADDAPDYKKATQEFFEKYFDLYDVYISVVVLVEINRTLDIEQKKKLLSVIEDYNLHVYGDVTDEIEALANLYLDKKIIPMKKREDALHVAFATYYSFDILLSWNFKHLANVKKQREINIINLGEGYSKPLNLVNPLEVFYEK